MNIDIRVFAGSGNPKLTQHICDYLNITPGQSEVRHFSDGNTFVRILENVRGRRVYIVQSTIFPTNDKFMELVFWLDAFKRASVESVTAIIPYFSYAKGDKKDEPRVSIRARVCADMIQVAGADRVVTMDLHTPQIQGFFKVPVDNLYAMPLICERIRQKQFENLIVVSPDIGFAKQARKYASLLNTNIAIADKQRPEHNEKAEVLEIIGNVAGKTALIVDDFSLSGGTLAAVAEKLLDQGAVEVYAAVTHGLLTPAGMDRIEDSPIKRLLITDTVENHPTTFTDKVEVVPTAPLFGEAIKRIYNRESISAMFTR